MIQRRLGLPVADWPHLDRIALDAAFAKESRFSRGPAAHWAPGTRHAVTTAVGRWLGFLTLFEPSTLAGPPLDRVTEDRLTHYVAHLSETVGSVGRHLYLRNLQKAFRVMFQGAVPDVLLSLVAQLNRECRPRPKAWVTTQQLVALGKEMMQRSIGNDSEFGKVLYRDGLMIMLWALRPERRRGFAQIRIGHQLCQVGEEWRLIFAAEERKSRRPSQMTVPQTVVPFLERYLEDVRPQFPDASNHDALWLSMKGRPLSPALDFEADRETHRGSFWTSHSAAPLSPLRRIDGRGFRAWTKSSSRRAFSTMPHSRRHMTITFWRARSKRADIMRRLSPTSHRGDLADNQSSFSIPE